ncbi:MAG: hypothetical protein UW41_C0009G0012 [Candidatus Collierbacteria bacterium GW2011_GWC2_44_18]|uniref:Uncharacterized protein n=2 Tax=Microgenomates group TaxID=1794810 RepID=A0A0G1J836_9BACT|nr:MAG: hypothetical protein UW16_C0005G0014 [Microgenomates group bacterium GW2011_GWC1_44_10]KKT49245.1 MAG: hypothetical protein UW41_C0009G0012 [Candidatus Collierbacteria bacterium GW2011_GWC2_44_18]KKT67450.1 MAG: hypothetical protein UW60_C0006G0014 [Candidatus Woesebacteria bacterium GW2011_GWA2_44_33]
MIFIDVVSMGICFDQKIVVGKFHRAILPQVRDKIYSCIQGNYFRTKLR